MLQTSVYRFANVPIVLAEIEQATEMILNKESGREHFHLLAASSFFRINKNPEISNALSSGINFCDSRPLASWISLRFKHCAQLRGTDLFRSVMQESGASDAHFFIGSTESTLERLSEQLNFEFPNVKISGLLSPDFRMPTKKDLNEWSTKIDSSGAEFVWLSLGSPKQDIVAHQLAQITAANVIAIGAALDFFSKTKSEAPRIIQKSHLEWLFRLIMEPKRLWRRYTLGNVYFLFLVLKDMCGMS